MTSPFFELIATFATHSEAWFHFLPIEGNTAERISFDNRNNGLKQGGCGVEAISGEKGTMVTWYFGAVLAIGYDHASAILFLSSKSELGELTYSSNNVITVCHIYEKTIRNTLCKSSSTYMGKKFPVTGLTNEVLSNFIGGELFSKLKSHMSKQSTLNSDI